LDTPENILLVTPKGAKAVKKGTIAVGKFGGGAFFLC
jgi:hypothetical protein